MKKSNENLSADRNILEALYEIGDSASKRIISIYPNLYPLDEKEDGYTAIEIRNRYGRGWGIENGSERAFTINAGSFACKASYDNIFTLICTFEKINKIKPKNRRKFILGQNKNNKTTL